MECFKIEWKGFYSWDEAQNRSEARVDGIYAVYLMQNNKIKELRYIGKSKEIVSRISTHRQGITRFMDDKGIDKFRICFGIIHSYETAHVSTSIHPDQLRNIESFLINYYKPEGNNPSTKKGYKLEPILLINTGKRGMFDKVIAHNADLLPLLKENLLPRKTTKSSSKSHSSIFDF